MRGTEKERDAYPYLERMLSTAQAHSIMAFNRTKIEGREREKEVVFKKRRAERSSKAS